jgi:proton-coupled amino acid transporter
MFATSCVSRAAPTVRARPSGRAAQAKTPLAPAARATRGVAVHAFPKRVPGCVVQSAASRVDEASSRRASVVARAASASTPAPAETGETAAVVNTVKAIFGAGGFSLPWAFAQGGIALVSACLLASYVFALEALKMLVRAQDTLIDNKVVSGYEQVQTYAGLTGAALGPAGDVLCKALNVITCFGISVGYIIFVSDTLISMLPAETQLSFSTARMIITSLPLWVALSWQRSFKGVNLISLLGTCSVALGMSWVTAVALGKSSHRSKRRGDPDGQPRRVLRVLRNSRVFVLHPLHAVRRPRSHARSQTIRPGGLEGVRFVDDRERFVWRDRRVGVRTRREVGGDHDAGRRRRHSRQSFALR